MTDNLLPDGELPLYPDNRPVRLAGLWLLTLLALVLGSWLAAVATGVGVPWPLAWAGLPWLWSRLMRQGLRRALGPDAARPQTGRYVSFVLSQVGFLLAVLLWLILNEPPDNTPWFD